MDCTDKGRKHAELALSQNRRLRYACWRILSMEAQGHSAWDASEAMEVR
jgi:hypothetical protein